MMGNTKKLGCTVIQKIYQKRFCWGSHPRTTVKNESGTHEFPCSSVGATPLLGKRTTGEKKYQKSYGNEERTVYDGQSHV